MPEVVRKYVEGENIVECQRVLDDLLLSYVDDFAKYKEHVPANRINTIFVSVSQQLGGKFVFSRSSQELNHYQAKMALDLLIKAGLVIPVTNCLANGIPLGAQVKPNYRKMLLLDTGLVLRLARLDIKSIITSSDTEFINKGNIAELFVGLEILKAESPYERNELYYWQREAINSNAEVDYLVQKDNKILPIEVKSGTKGSMQSLFLFLKEKHVEKGIRISLENYSTYQNIDVIPMYAVGDLIRS
jgi:predicted AAA+ superfamily ATPase